MYEMCSSTLRVVSMTVVRAIQRMRIGAAPSSCSACPSTSRSNDTAAASRSHRPVLYGTWEAPVAVCPHIDAVCGGQRRHVLRAVTAGGNACILLRRCARLCWTAPAALLVRPAVVSSVALHRHVPGPLQPAPPAPVPSRPTHRCAVPHQQSKRPPSPAQWSAHHTVCTALACHRAACVLLASGAKDSTATSSASTATSSRPGRRDPALALRARTLHRGGRDVVGRAAVEREDLACSGLNASHSCSKTDR